MKLVNTFVGLAETPGKMNMESQEDVALKVNDAGADLSSMETNEADVSSGLSLQHGDDDKSELCEKGDQEAVESNFDEFSNNGDDSEYGIAKLLREGTEFLSFEAFQATLQQYSDATFAQFAHQDSSTIEKLANRKDYNKKIVYSHLVFACIYGGKKLPSRSSGIRNCSSRKIGCPVKLRLGATPDKQRLLIKESKLDCHNHDLSEESYRFRSLDEETELEIYRLISMHENKRVARQLVRDKLAKETGKNVNMKDISNIEKRVIKKISTLIQIAGKDDEGKEEETDIISDTVEDDVNEREEDQQSTPDTLTDSPSLDKLSSSTPEVKDSPPSTPKVKVVDPSTSSSPVRPKRHIREPKRFRDQAISQKSSEAAPVSTPVEEEKTTKTTNLRTPRVTLSRLKVSQDSSETLPSNGTTMKTERRGRKRKVAPESEAAIQEVTADSECITADQTTDIVTEPSTQQSIEEVDRKHKMEIRERKIKIQEELLALEKKKIEMLQDITTKLDKVLENQNQGKG